MAKVLESWHLWGNSTRQKWNYIVSCTSKKQVDSFYGLCRPYHFNGCALCDGSAMELKREEWFIKDGYSAIPIMSYKRFREFLSGVR